MILYTLPLLKNAIQFESNADIKHFTNMQHF